MADLGVVGAGPDEIKVSLYQDPAGAENAKASVFWRPAYFPGDPVAENIEVRATSAAAADTLTIRGDFTDQPSWVEVRFLNDNPVARNLHVTDIVANGQDFLDEDVPIWGEWGVNFDVTVEGDATTTPPPPPPPPVPGAVFRGTTRADTVQGGAGDDTMFGLGGDDLLLGWAGNDVINAGPGNDTIEGGLGNDTINGASGVDVVFFVEGEGDDVFTDFTPGQDLVLLEAGTEGFELTAVTRGGVTGTLLGFGEGAEELGSLFLPNVSPDQVGFYTALI